MTNKIHEQCSCLIDGELEESECCAILDKIGDSDELKQGLHRYFFIRDTIQRNLPNVINTNFPQSVMAAIESEPTILAPPSSKSSPSPELPQEKRISRMSFSKRAASFAIAASVATVAIFTFNPTNNIDQTTGQIAQMPDSSEFIRLSKSTPVAPGSVSVVPAGQQQLSGNMYVSQQLRSSTIPVKTMTNMHSQQIRNYIINHNQHISSSSLQSVMPYARIVVTKPSYLKQEQARQ